MTTLTLDRSIAVVDEIMQDAERRATAKQNELAQLALQRAELQKTESERLAEQAECKAAELATTKKQYTKDRVELKRDLQAVASNAAEWKKAVDAAHQTISAAPAEQTAIRGTIGNALNRFEALSQNPAADPNELTELLNLLNGLDLELHADFRSVDFYKLTQPNRYINNDIQHARNLIS